jgi:hypothetical protein
MFAITPSHWEYLHGEWQIVGREFIFSRWDEVNYELGYYGLTVAGNP